MAVNISQQLIAYRKANKLTQEDVAALMDTTQQTVANWERGTMPRPMALAGILAGAAQGNAVVDGAVITDFCRFAEHDAHTVVNEQPVADLGTGVDLDAGQVAGQLADEARQEETLVTVQKMCNFVRYQHMETGVQNDDLRHIACSRVLVPDVFCVCPKSHPTYLISFVSYPEYPRKTLGYPEF